MTRLVRTFAVFAALCLISAPVMAGNPFAFGNVWSGPYQNQIVYPYGGWSNANYGYYGNAGYSNYGYSNYGYSNYGYSNYGRRAHHSHYTPSHGGPVPRGTTYSVPTYGGSIQVQHLGLPGLQNVITLPPGYTVQGAY